MRTSRDITHAGVGCVGEHETLAAAAQRMRDPGVDALSICGDDGRRHGMLPDRDVVIKCVAAEHDPGTMTAGELARGNTYHVDAEASIEELLNVMEEHRERRLPVIDDRRLVGIVSEADIARQLPEPAIAHFVKPICAPQAVSSR
ncbi:CBS domain-containing protein [Mycobacterium shinjukuense]|uniref:Hypoxic response protein 1 n=1 Tax=Mycobacterium shinjukuense TaxID=398694 RepID=A0A7I7MT16_9MYCO|nr:CBS domain-containing protein [Mycobacterium shinjukuense]MCV6984985.1 CBS domain-containing protein [Mycobacterium shinjukuense]ORB69358.1 CBS domain-containing protein [Mycobacterium shinjukuense]BBX74947.1 hypoxic response protein 1 [Mycobacterium shinjukuense]